MAKVAVVGLGVALSLWPLTWRLVARIPTRARPWLFGRRVWAGGLVVFATTLVCLRIADFSALIPVSTILLFDGRGSLGCSASERASGSRPERPSRGRRVAIVGFFGGSVAAMLMTNLAPGAESPFRDWTHTTVLSQFRKMFANGAPKQYVELDIELLRQGTSPKRSARGSGCSASMTTRASTSRSTSDASCSVPRPGGVVIPAEYAASEGSRAGRSSASLPQFTAPEPPVAGRARHRAGAGGRERPNPHAGARRVRLPDPLAAARCASR